MVRGSMNLFSSFCFQWCSNARTLKIKKYRSFFQHQVLYFLIKLIHSLKCSSSTFINGEVFLTVLISKAKSLGISSITPKNEHQFDGWIGWIPTRNQFLALLKGKSSKARFAFKSFCCSLFYTISFFIVIFRRALIIKVVDVFYALQLIDVSAGCSKWRKIPKQFPFPIQRTEILSKCYTRGFWHHRGSDQTLQHILGEPWRCSKFNWFWPWATKCANFKFFLLWAGWIRELQASFQPQIQQ